MPFLHLLPSHYLHDRLPLLSSYAYQHSTQLPGSPQYDRPHHPIYYLAEEARTRFEASQRHQSRSLVEAVAEYERRYGHSPPPGFDKWYDFVVENNVRFIDEYDFMTSLDLYWHVSPKVLRDYVEQASSMPSASSRLAILEIKDRQANLRNGNHQHGQLVRLLQSVMEFLPDVRMLLNNLDEPRVIVPHDVLRSPLPTKSPTTQNLDGPTGQTASFSFTDLGRQKPFETIILSCPADSPVRSTSTQAGLPNPNIPFISNITDARDVCQSPASIADQHGLLNSPGTFLFTHQLVPIACTGKISTFQDVVFPSSYYFQDDVSDYDASWDRPWEEKEDVVY